MCGKFTQHSTWREVHAFTATRHNRCARRDCRLNPMRFANIIRLNDTGEREVVPMRWGFAGKGDKNLSRPKHMYARSETIERLPTFANSFRQGRTLTRVTASQFSR